MVRHYSVPCSAYFEIYLNREDFLNILWRFVSREELTKKRVSRSRDRRFILSVLLKMMVRQNSVPCFAYFEIYLKRDDFLNILWRFVSREELTKKRVSRSRDRRFILSVLLKNVVATFKETSDMLENICAGISWFSWMSSLIYASSPFCKPAI